MPRFNVNVRVSSDQGLSSSLEKGRSLGVRDREKRFKNFCAVSPEQYGSDRNIASRLSSTDRSGDRGVSISGNTPWIASVSNVRSPVFEVIEKLCSSKSPLCRSDPKKQEQYSLDSKAFFDSLSKALSSAYPTNAEAEKKGTVGSIIRQNACLLADSLAKKEFPLYPSAVNTLVHFLKLLDSPRQIEVLDEFNFDNHSEIKEEFRQWVKIVSSDKSVQKELDLRAKKREKTDNQAKIIISAIKGKTDILALAKEYDIPEKDVRSLDDLNGDIEQWADGGKDSIIDYVQKQAIQARKKNPNQEYDENRLVRHLMQALKGEEPTTNRTNKAKKEFEKQTKLAKKIIKDSLESDWKVFSEVRCGLDVKPIFKARVAIDVMTDNKTINQKAEEFSVGVKEIEKWGCQLVQGFAAIFNELWKPEGITKEEEEAVKGLSFQAVLAAIKSHKTINELVKEFNIDKEWLKCWKKLLLDYAEDIFNKDWKSEIESCTEGEEKVEEGSFKAVFVAIQHEQSIDEQNIDELVTGDKIDAEWIKNWRKLVVDSNKYIAQTPSPEPTQPVELAKGGGKVDKTRGKLNDFIEKFKAKYPKDPYNVQNYEDKRKIAYRIIQDRAYELLVSLRKKKVIVDDLMVEIIDNFEKYIESPDRLDILENDFKLDAGSSKFDECFTEWKKEILKEEFVTKELKRQAMLQFMADIRSYCAIEMLGQRKSIVDVMEFITLQLGNLEMNLKGKDREVDGEIKEIFGGKHLHVQSAINWTRDSNVKAKIKSLEDKAVSGMKKMFEQEWKLGVEASCPKFKLPEPESPKFRYIDTIMIDIESAKSTKSISLPKLGTVRKVHSEKHAISNAYVGADNSLLELVKLCDSRWSDNQYPVMPKKSDADGSEPSVSMDLYTGAPSKEMQSHLDDFRTQFIEYVGDLLFSIYNKNTENTENTENMSAEAYKIIQKEAYKLLKSLSTKNFILNLHSARAIISFVNLIHSSRRLDLLDEIILDTKEKEVITCFNEWKETVCQHNSIKKELEKRKTLRERSEKNADIHIAAIAQGQVSERAKNAKELIYRVFNSDWKREVKIFASRHHP